MLCALLGGALEYGTSLWMEAIFHARWWDYAGWAWNLEGRVCLASAAAFGLVGWLLVRRVGPHLYGILSAMPARPRTALCRTLCVLFALDIVISIAAPNLDGSFPL